jgi:hypothetical protein
MRIPFLHRKPEDIASIARRATYVPSHEVAGPRLTRATPEQRERASALFRTLRNGSAPPK